MTQKTPRASRNKPLSPVRAALRPESDLRHAIQDGLDGLESADRACIHSDLRTQFADSLALDAAMQHGREQEHRWDYLLGHTPTRKVIALEPHSAKEDEVSTVILKRKAAMDQLRPHLKDGASVHAWLWVASRKVQFADTEKTRLRLDQAGIRFVGRQLLPKHLDAFL